MKPTETIRSRIDAAEDHIDYLRDNGGTPDEVNDAVDALIALHEQWKQHGEEEDA